MLSSARITPPNEGNKQSSESTFRNFQPTMRSKQSEGSGQKLNEIRLFNKEQQDKFLYIQRRVNHIKQQEVKSLRTYNNLETQLSNILTTKTRFDEDKKYKLLYQDQVLHQQQTKFLEMNKRRLEQKFIKQNRNTMYFQQLKKNVLSMKNYKNKTQQDHLHSVQEHQNTLFYNKSDIKEQQIQGQISRQNYNLQKQKNIQGLYQKMTKQTQSQTLNCQAEMDNLEKQEEDLFLSIQRSQNLYLDSVDEMNEIQRNSPKKILEQFSMTQKQSQPTQEQPRNYLYASNVFLRINFKISSKNKYL